ncbi:1-acylglycerol-3-phosphate O-acyltransferase 6 (lysophosphatidic acid acyltransferase, zeta) [Cyanidiococcus yangmingshanensis]|uniref:1-acylglycerol-3-phosphate O-acyltransferase 6 (Lysophosphatidic acid acyltransferase, zeta) n=1 Tax=Cyanidiococcus yangmingshanensis TaxID=2690220 RepID=A0A7J7IH83_9RHOD|nr:1-acylglycerol-3-phosphate O-acyltransferase 6 (lysophosphatidic acid acyltransferase, zeta) [Cyanidiococcus yangmingshanensis]
MVGDSLTRCFESSPPKVWNLMTRTSATGIPILLWPLWFLSIFIRYGILLPFRIFVLSAGVFSFALGFSFVQLSLRKRTRLKVYLQKQLIRFLASTLVASWSGLVHYHGERPRRRPNQIYVANHTSPIDLAMMIKDYPFSAIGQRHGGLAGRIQDLLNLVQNHVWFDREEGHDRRIVQRLLQAHVQDGEKEPVLVFPEGTCVNNEYCIMFKKGSFELGAQVYPVAIKYNKAYADVYWNSAKQTFLTHLLALMTSWAVVCDVYYLEPQSLRANETPAAFAARVKRLIARRIGLIETNWDGFLKRHQLSPKFREHRQEVLAYRIRKHLERVSVAALPSIPEESPLKPESKTGVDGEIHASETDTAVITWAQLVAAMAGNEPVTTSTAHPKEAESILRQTTCDENEHVGSTVHPLGMACMGWTRGSSGSVGIAPGSGCSRFPCPTLVGSSVRPRDVLGNAVAAALHPLDASPSSDARDCDCGSRGSTARAAWPQAGMETPVEMMTGNFRGTQAR